uniref:Beta-lactamase n=1 Tax=Cyanothece sp. (strain PCC 7425 / ATCC 29141) TaxID=395961 RepID=B8HUW4_CYAP4
MKINAPGRWLHLIALFGWLWWASLASAGQENTGIVGRIDRLVQSTREQKHIPGLAIAIVQQGKPLLIKGYGQANLEQMREAERNSVFPLASITKLFTAMGILRLQEMGQLQLSDPLSRYLEFPRGGEITLSHLLTHTSGLAEIWSVEPVRSRQSENWQPAQLVDVLRSQPLNFAPGQQCQYSNSNYVLLGLILEKVSGQTYDQFIRSQIAQPLGMTSTRSGSVAEIIPHRVAGYQWFDRQYQNAPYPNLNLPFATGNLISTIADMARLDQGFVPGNILSPASLALMQTPVRLNNGQICELKDFFGLSSFGVGTELWSVSGKPAIAKTGGISGFNTFIAHFLDPHLTIVVLSNREASLEEIINLTAQISQSLISPSQK